MTKNEIDTIVFDLGGVLIDWNPKHLYRKIFATEEEIDWFLTHVCTSEWNDEQDAGRSFHDGTQELIARFPAHREAIEAWYGRWQETISGPINGTVDVLKSVKDAGQHRLYALTNWSAETFPWAFAKFEFLQLFEGIVVSGVEKMRKPQPAFYQRLFDRYDIIPQRSLFIDDNVRNIEAAQRLGLNTIHFRSPDQLRVELIRLGILLAR